MSCHTEVFRFTYCYSSRAKLPYLKESSWITLWHHACQLDRHFFFCSLKNCFWGCQGTLSCSDEQGKQWDKTSQPYHPEGLEQQLLPEIYQYIPAFICQLKNMMNKILNTSHTYIYVWMLINIKQRQNQDFDRKSKNPHTSRCKGT